MNSSPWPAQCMTRNLVRWHFYEDALVFNAVGVQRALAG